MPNPVLPQFCPPNRSWWCIVCTNQTPRVVQVEASPLLECEKQDHWGIIDWIQIPGNGDGMGSATVDLLFSSV